MGKMQERILRPLLWRIFLFVVLYVLQFLVSGFNLVHGVIIIRKKKLVLGSKLPPSIMVDRMVDHEVFF